MVVFETNAGDLYWETNSRVDRADSQSKEINQVLSGMTEAQRTLSGNWKGSLTTDVIVDVPFIHKFVM